MNKYEILKFKAADFEIDVNVSPMEETVWLTQEQISKLYGKARSTITEHINNIFSSEELDKNTSVGFSDESVNHRPAKFIKKRKQTKLIVCKNAQYWFMTASPPL